MPDPDTWADSDDPELTDEEIEAILLEADETMPDLPTLARKHLANRTIQGLTDDEADADGIEDDDPTDPLFPDEGDEELRF